MKKYNIAYIPKSKKSEFTLYSNSLNANKGIYKLGQNSIPHVTVCQFLYEPEDLQNLWEKIVGSLVNKLEITLQFENISNITFNKQEYWLSLIPNERILLEEIYKIVQQHVIPMYKNAYDPHMTMFNYFPEKADKKFPTNFLISDDFEIVLGECDEVGQLTSVVFDSHIRNKAFRP